MSHPLPPADGRPEPGAGLDPAAAPAAQAAQAQVAETAVAAPRKGGLLRSASLFTSVTFLSRITGLIRDQLYAWQFGTSPALDAFFVAFRIPNFMRRLSAEGSFSMAFVPVLSEYKEQRDHAAVKDLVDKVTGTLLAALLVVTAAVVLAAPWVMRLFAPGFEPGGEQYAMATRMLQIVFPYALFISLASLAGGVLNSYGKFAIPGLSPVLLNLTMIAASLCAGVLMRPFGVNPVYALAWGVFVGGILQLACQLPAMARLGLLPRPRWGGSDPGVRKIMRLMVPTLFGSSVAQVNLLLNTALASFLIAGSVSWLYLTDRLLEFPLGMIGVAIGTVILPHLSKRHAATDPQGFSQGLDWGMRVCLVVGIPACLGLMLCAQPLVASLFQYGQLTPEDTRMISWSLVAQASAVPAFLLVKVLAPAFYSRQDTRTPVKSAVVSVLINLSMTLLLLGCLLYLTPIGQQALAASGGDLGVALGRIPGAHVCLAAAIAIAGWSNALQLGWYLRRAQVFTPQPGWPRLLRQLLLAGAGMSVVLLAWQWAWDAWPSWPWWERLWKLAVVVASGAISYAALLWLQGMRPRDLRH